MDAMVDFYEPFLKVYPFQSYQVEFNDMLQICFPLALQVEHKFS